MFNYNSKINNVGKYLRFNGWSTIAFIEENPQNFVNMLEEYLTKEPVLSYYFSALPHSSYHVTVHNIWANGAKLLPHQSRFLNDNYSGDEKKKLINRASKKGYFNPDSCMDKLLTKLDEALPQVGTTELVIGGLYFTGNTLAIWFSDESNTNNLDLCRSVCNKIVEKNERVEYHMTLAYNYRDVIWSDISEYIEEMNNKLKGTSIKLQQPFVAYFSDMTKFIPYTFTLGFKCNEKMVWE